ncbi:MAG: hypothetical protein IIA44_13040, partial [Acidobacteria bacterium]|nr:hypothetical protein [Acidobacteriota bacterium]
MDGGDSWENVVDKIPGLPERTYVSRLTPSAHAPGRVYATFDGHRNSDFAAYAYVSEDYGQHWESIAGDLPDGWSVNVITEHHLAENLLFIGNEIGVQVSIDRGERWTPLKNNLPVVPVDDIAIHPRETDLIVGTHGRSVFLLDAKTIVPEKLTAKPTANTDEGASAHKYAEDFARAARLRPLGPAYKPGRVAEIAVDPTDRSTWYLAQGSGGLWKTTNRGNSWKPIFDEGGSYSLGYVTVDARNPNVVWLGTGENISNRSVGYGDGVYKSNDGGETWTNVGLRDSEHIGKIIIDPRDSNVVYVAAEGPLWSPGGDRGLYKTVDGGATWKAVLQISKNTGVTDMAMDPRDPNVIYASSFQRRRRVGQLIGGGPESAIYKTTDGGDTWKKLTKGIPSVDKGRIALAVSPQKPDVVYALVTPA